MSRARFTREVGGPRAVTLVLGAGVSIDRGAPAWRALSRDLYTKAFGEAPPALSSDAADPLSDPMALELVRAHLGEASFAAALRRRLYARSGGRFRRLPPGATLAAVADVVRAQQASPSRRLLRVVSFNADDHLEREVHRGKGWLGAPIAWPIARESQPPRALGKGGRPPVPVYHVHGFLPRDAEGARRAWQDAPDTLVFADDEYWASVAEPLSFPNRVLAAALHDSVCVFVGTSMRDHNLLRGLGLRRFAHLRDARAAGRGDASVTRALARHFWLTSEAPSPLAEVLERRGVTSVLCDWRTGDAAELLRRALLPRAVGAHGVRPPPSDGQARD
ncbi:MAG: SIR2 family protein [Polyangiaceae bacterium]|nr:SIR2 family protein [Polyangiaceae bacterium]